jgi:hypothetical protein
MMSIRVATATLNICFNQSQNVSFNPTKEITGINMENHGSGSEFKEGGMNYGLPADYQELKIERVCQDDAPDTLFDSFQSLEIRR